MKRLCGRTGKVRYGRRLDAKIALADTTAMVRDRSEKRIYWCSFCHGLHLTSQEK